MADESKTVDENRYSRQIGVYGMSTMKKLMGLKVLIVGMKGVGVEAAKNLILAGPAAVTIFDPEPAVVQDLACNFYLSEGDVGKPRADSVVAQLARLNSYVTVRVLNSKTLSESDLDAFHVVLFTNTPRSQCIRFNEYCRNHSPPIGFVASDVMGAAGWAFSDFGDEWTVSDRNGEPLRSGIVELITPSEDGDKVTVLVDEKTRHGLSDGDCVVFEEVKGMTQLNDNQPRKVSNVRPRSFEISGTTGYGEHTGGGVFEQVKVPFQVARKSMRHRSLHPAAEFGMATPDTGAFDAPLNLHLAFLALDAFRAAHDGALPGLHDDADAAEVVELARKANATLETPADPFPEAFVRRVASISRAEFEPLCAFYGGLVAQEIVKFTGKYTPLDGWLYMDALNSLPEKLEKTEYQLASGGSRYDHWVSMLGTTFFERIRKLKLFLVGSGALGCEFLKAFALMGVGSGEGGQVTVTDMDTIEDHNLNRQFLFRTDDVGSDKSTTAANAAKAMNPDLNVHAMQDPVGEDTEDIFDDAFWDSQGLMVNALDNIKARLYVDSKCLLHTKPLLESGTLGTKANAQVVAPHLTQAYGDSRDPPEDSFPVCTLKHFPHKIEHCIEWARDDFEGRFASAVADTQSFITDRKAFMSNIMSEPNVATKRQRLEGVIEVLDAAKTRSYLTCLRIAKTAFHHMFYTEIAQLLHNFPRDHVTKSGAPFWSGSKRPPTAIPFDSNDALHLEFIVAAAHVAADTLCIPMPANAKDKAYLQEQLETIVLPDFKPRKVRIKADENDKTEEGGDDDAAVVKQCCQRLVGMPAAEVGELRVAPAAFEKDDDSNYHIAYISATANLRARNYSIKECSKHKAKMIAGKIIPAIATTTAMITGLVCCELFKVVAGAPIEKLRDTFINTGINMYSMTEPRPPSKTKSCDRDPTFGTPVHAIPEGFTSWDKVIVDEGNVTLQQLVDHVEEEMGIEIQIVSCGPKMMFAPLMFAAHRARADKSVKEVYDSMFPDAPLPKSRTYIMLDVSAEDTEGVDVVMPPIKVIFRK